jgi:uncharacterized membrane protein
MKLFQLKKEIFALLLILGILIVGLLDYSSLPDRVATHWNAANQIDGWSSPETVAFTMPLLFLGLYLLLSFIVYLDPFRKNIESFYHIFWHMKLAFVIFLAIVYLTIIINALSEQSLAVDKIIILTVAALFIYLGFLMPSFKRNFFIGIRLPWTISSTEVWQATHKVGRNVFILLGIIIALSTLLSGEIALIIILGSVMLAIIYLGFYSYFKFKNLPENKKINL